MSYKIQSKFLRLFTNFYGNTGLQLRSVNFSKSTGSSSFYCAGGLNFLWNLALVLHTNYFIFFSEVNNEVFDEQVNRTMTSIGYKHRPLFRIVHQFAVFIAFPVNYWLLIAYFIWYAISCDDLIRLLDSLHHKSLSTGSRRHFFAILALDQSIFVIMYPILWRIARRIDPLRDPITVLTFVHSYFVFYCTNINNNLCLHLIHYYKLATWRRLRRLHRRILEDNDDDCDENISEVFQLEMRHLAAVNDRLNRIFSFPFLVNLSMLTIDVLMVVSSAVGLAEVNWENIGYIVQYFAHLTYVLWICKRIDETQRSIQTQCIAKQQRALFGEDDGSGDRCFRTIFPNINNQNRNTNSNSKSKTIIAKSRASANRNRIEKSKLESVLIRDLYCADLYGKYLRFCIFNLFTLDLRALLGLAFFVLNYIVLISQTNS